MLTKEKLSKIAEEAIGTLHYICAVTKVTPQDSYAMGLYDQANDELVARWVTYEGDEPGWFTLDYVSEQINKNGREVIRNINSQLYDYFDKKLEPKYYIKLLNTEYGYLARVEGTDTWSVTSLKIAKMSNQKVAFTADEISEIANSDLCANLNPMDLWRAAEEVEED